MSLVYRVYPISKVNSVYKQGQTLDFIKNTLLAKYKTQPSFASCILPKDKS